ncbi:MAG: ASKHA domain-containing protein, partial [Desulfovibrio sp.]|nr:ASKHA domain-containing protein [Desulfovibrio sp.]
MPDPVNAGAKPARITVKKGRTPFAEITAAEGANLLDALRDKGFALPADCGGQGLCGKCLVRVNGELRPACRLKVYEGLRLELPETEEATIQTWYPARPEENPTEPRRGTQGSAEPEISPPFSPVGRSDAKSAALAQTARPDAPGGRGTSARRFCLAADIGTTTVVAQIAAFREGEAPRILGTRSFLNGQRSYGADVLSRIRSADEGNLGAMSAIIRSSLGDALFSLCAEAGLDPEEASSLCVAGNTAMIHILLGAPCSSLGRHPYTIRLDLKDSYTFAEVFGKGNGPVVRILPWISAYVGGDISAGYLACRGRRPETALLLDLGTNGEMLLWSGERAWCCSAPSGPAFEGCGISCGVGGVRGAICRVDLLEGNLICRTIEGASPVGVCGSGVLDVLACLRRGGRIDAEGRLEERLFEKGARLARAADGRAITFTQGDVREAQLAKAAVRAGLEVLFMESGLRVEDLDSLYLAGGFGQQLRLESAVVAGLLPPEAAAKAIPVGNSALGGAMRLCGNPELLKEAQSLRERTLEILPAQHPDFQDLFIRHISFERSHLPDKKAADHQ